MLGNNVPVTHTEGYKVEYYNYSSRGSGSFNTRPDLCPWTTSTSTINFPMHPYKQLVKYCYGNAAVSDTKKYPPIEAKILANDGELLGCCTFGYC